VIQSSPPGSFAVATTAVINNNLTIADQQFLLGDQLTVSGLLTWTAGNQSSIDGPGQVNANGGMAITGIGSKILTNGCTLNNAATATWTGGSIALSQGAVWNNLSGSTLAVQNNDTFGVGRLGTFNNAGTVRKSSSGITYFGAAFQSTGTVDVQSGTLVLYGVGNSNGSFTVGTAGTLEFGGLSQVLQPGSQVSGMGNVRVSSGSNSIFGSYNVTGTTTCIGGTINFMADATLGQLTMTGGRLAGSGPGTVSGLLDWTDGTMAGPGRTVANGPVALRSNTLFGGPFLDGRTFYN